MHHFCFSWFHTENILMALMLLSVSLPFPLQTCTDAPQSWKYNLCSLTSVLPSIFIQSVQVEVPATHLAPLHPRKVAAVAARHPQIIFLPHLAFGHHTSLTITWTTKVIRQRTTSSLHVVIAGVRNWAPEKRKQYVLSPCFFFFFCVFSFSPFLAAIKSNL